MFLKVIGNIPIFLTIFILLARDYIAQYQYFNFVFLIAAFIVYVSMFIGRLKIQKTYQFAILHVAFLGLTFFVPSGYFGTFFYNFVLCSIVISIIKIINKEMPLNSKNPLLTGLGWIFFIVSMSYVVAPNVFLINMLAFGTVFITILLAIVYICIDNFKEAMIEATEKKYIAIGDIKRSNIELMLGLIIIIIVLGIASLLVSSNWFFGMTFTFFRYIIFYFIVTPFYLITSRLGIEGLGTIATVMPDTFDIVENGAYYTSMPMLANGFSVINFLQVLASVAAVIIVSILLYFVYVFVKKNIGSGKNGYTKAKMLYNENVTELKIEYAGMFGIMPRKKILPKNKIRRAYIKKINEHIKNGVKISNSNTVDQIENKIAHIEDIGSISQRYKQVRYGKDSNV